ncbi:MAG TPA: hypothetical protein VMT29_18015 [Steroidobacteraceae bacterium]|nr:hypothetical protein [Steroidobacteraceae bacterium]
MDRNDSTFDRRLYTAMGILAVAIVFVGFSRTFYLREWFGSPPLSTLRYLHGTLMTCWYVLFLTQILLVSRHRTDIHRRLGILAGLTAAALLPVGAMTAIGFVTRMRPSPDDAADAAVIAGYDFVALTVFGLLVATALVLRQRSDIHKRLMTLASLSLLGPPLARLVSDEHSLWLTYAFLMLPIAIDTWRHGRVHPAFAWGGALVLIISEVTLHYVTTPGWIAFALRTFP